MKREELKSKVFIGVVEDNDDPKKIGRVKVRVFNVFDRIPKEDLPWASPWKDLAGNTFLLPEIGKIVSCVFDDGNPYKPEYIYADHYNINLEKKLQSLSGDDYTSMRALMFDHKTQIYSNDKEGLVIDYKYNNINITKDTIDINLKDNQGKLSLGDAKARQQAILGTNFMNWFDELVDNLLGLQAGPYIGNSGSPVVANPALTQCLNKYKALRDPKFLSDNVYIIDNNNISTVTEKQSERQNNPQLGDVWVSTVEGGEEGKPRTDSNSGDFTPQVDLNNQANLQNDPLLGSQVPTTPPAYLDPSVGPASGLTTVFAQEMVKLARTQVGVGEPQWTYQGKTYKIGGNSGPQVEALYQRSTELTGSGWPWCAAFICWLFKSVSEKGIAHSFKLPKTAGAYNFINWARNNSSFVEIYDAPFTSILPGDIIVFNFSHIGLAVGELKGGRFDTIEGNTTPGPSSRSKEREGGGVFERSRGTDIIKNVIRLKYNPNQVRPLK